ncbi:hypothetical protein M408DRAFT_328575 [Serendipita vermifera MAFF 305830]|uniref:BTB domain-containing protein n=1 Tax=Serendipita vermifera MAFF 305830 TaxID=933852 RepID=A0A0C3BE38_SERVB|nr:hypothetical protein M408DRAFT_328575 [Serendipita vermifera MAFF 305830]
MANADQMANEAQRHPKFYIPSGDMVIQVERTIFKVHSHFLTTQSEVFRDMVTAAPQSNEYNDGTESKPLILSGDRVEGWELFLSAIYRDDYLQPITYSGKESIEILHLAHKYCMNSIEAGLISRLKGGTGTAGFLDMMVASRIVDSKELYDTALQGLIVSEPKPTLEEARMIGIEAYYAITTQSLTTQSTTTKGRCRFCQHANLTMACNGGCGQWQE